MEEAAVVGIPAGRGGVLPGVYCFEAVVGRMPTGNMLYILLGLSWEAEGACWEEGEGTAHY